MTLLPARQRLDEVLEFLGVGAKKSLGQNFLVSDPVIEKILSAAQGFSCEQMVEIGPGPGALTDGLRQLGKPLQVIELDRAFAEYWRGQGINVIEADALKYDWAPLANGRTLLVSNLPYQISSSLVIERSLDDDLLAGMVLMFQKEVAQRIRAEAGTEHYGLLSVIAQNFWDVGLVCDVGPKDFWPPPKIASRVLGFKPKTGQEIKSSQAKRKFLALVKQGFSQRRKLLRKNLSGILQPPQLAQYDSWIQAHSINSQARAEELSPLQWCKLFKAIQW